MRALVRRPTFSFLMLGVYLLAAVLGGGLLLLPFLGGDDGGGHDADAAHAGPGELLFGFFRPRNLIVFLATFGVTGSLLAWLDRSPALTLVLAAAMGSGAMAMSHGLFLWLKRSDSAVEALGDAELEGSSARVVLPLAPGEAGRVVCVVGGREQYLTARLTADIATPIGTGREVVIIQIIDGVAQVSPLDADALPTERPLAE